MKVKESEVRELGRLIYEEIAQLNAQPSIQIPGATPTSRELRLEELHIAQKANSISLMGF